LIDTAVAKSLKTESPRNVTVLDKQRAFDGYFKIDRYRLRHSLHEGGESEPLLREIFERGHIAAVLPVDPERDSLVLIEQFRPGAYAAGWDAWLLECVAGIIEPGEPANAVAVREAQEEAGCTLSDTRLIMSYLSTPGASSETVALFVARVDSRDAGGVHGLRHEGEDIKVRVVSINEAMRHLQAGKIVNAKTIIALQWLQLNYTELKNDWLGVTHE